VHGGPGAGSYALKPLEALADERPVVRYDQLGAGRSDQVRDTELYVIPRFVAELDSLRAALGFERVHLVGQSWGGALALEYQRTHPERVTSLVLASPLISAPERIRARRALLATLSEAARNAIKESEAVGDYDSPDYLAAVSAYNERYVYRRPNAADQDSIVRSLRGGQFLHLWGPSEFTVTGTLRRHDATRRLRALRLPTLFLVGEHDAADTAAVRRYAGLVRDARFAVIPDAAHIMTWDNPQETSRIIREFLRSVDPPAPADSMP
jgi:proline iminopeptidase